MSFRQNILLGFAVLSLAVLLQSFFIVDEREQAIVLQFGRPVNIIQEAGLNIKIPFIQQVEFFDQRVLEIDPDPERVILSSERGSLLKKLTAADKVISDEANGIEPTEKEDAPINKDERNVSGEPIIVDTFARYKITDPLKYRQRLATEFKAVQRLQSEINSTTRDVLGQSTLEELLSPSRSRLMREIQRRVNGEVGDLGIEIVDVRIGRADLTPNLMKATFNRMRSERQQRATEIRSIGEERALKIRSGADKEKTVLLSKANQESETIRGQGDRDAINIYAEAFKRDPEFYAFYRSLEAYKKGLNKDNTTMVLSPDSDFFRFFKNMNGN